jgi:hypothetical protein
LWVQHRRNQDHRARNAHPIFLNHDTQSYHVCPSALSFKWFGGFDSLLVASHTYNTALEFCTTHILRNIAFSLWLIVLLSPTIVYL